MAALKLALRDMPVTWTGTGWTIWKFNTGRDLDSSPCVVDGRFYIAGENGYARYINPQTGKQIWKTFLGGIGPGTKGGSNGAETSPVIADGDYYAATYDGDLLCLDSQARQGNINGPQVWPFWVHSRDALDLIAVGSFMSRVQASHPAAIRPA